MCSLLTLYELKFLDNRVIDPDSDRGDLHPDFSHTIRRLFTVSAGKVPLGFGMPSFIAHSDIWGESPRLRLKDDALTVRAEVRLSVLKPHHKYRAPLVEALEMTHRKLYSSDLGRDFVLVSFEGAEIPVHKAVLSSASPVFCSMFESNLEECRSGRCEISDFDKATLNSLLRFMYYSCVEAVNDNARILLEAANKYELSALKGCCEDTLIAEISMDNVVELLFFAEKMTAPELKKAALRYLAADPGKTMKSQTVKDEVFGSGNKDIIAEVFAAMFKLSAQQR